MAAPSFNAGQVSVGSSATKIVGGNESRHTVVITNLGSTAVYIGPNANVTSSNGQLLPGSVGASISIPTSGPVYGVASTGSQTVSFLDV